jgi:hypothetical protein
MIWLSMVWNRSPVIPGFIYKVMVTQSAGFLAEGMDVFEALKPSSFFNSFSLPIMGYLCLALLCRAVLYRVFFGGELN